MASRRQKLTEVLHVRVTPAIAAEVYRQAMIRHNGDISEYLRDRLARLVRTAPLTESSSQTLPYTDTSDGPTPK